MAETTLADLIARNDPSVMLGPAWTPERWPVDPSARGLPSLDTAGQLQGYGWWVPFGEGWEIPAGFEYSGSGPFDWAIWIHVVDGKPECVALTGRGTAKPITADSLRRLPLGRLVQEGVLLASRPWDEIPKRYGLWPNTDAVKRERVKVAKRYARLKRSPREHGEVSDVLLEDVARIYRENLATGAPTKAVASELNYSRASAGRLVGLARRSGLLPKTEMRKARG